MWGELALVLILAADPPTWSELARPVVRPPGFPAESAVCFSSRWQHPSGPDDPHDTFAAAAAFHATGFYWCSGPSADYFAEIVRRGYPVQGWLSTIMPDTVFGRTRQRGRILDAQGNLVCGPWMRSFEGWWGCVNSPEHRQVYLDHIRAYLAAGVGSLQMDDPGWNGAATAWGGCYCPHCREQAAAAGVDPPAIQERSTHEFYREVRAAMDALAGRHVPFSCNAHPSEARFYPDIFDFGLRELSEDHARPARLHAEVRDAEARGKGILYTYVSRDQRLTRATIALAYALGTQIIVPWDVYIGDRQPRQFGRPEAYADLYGFARGAAAHLDGYTEAAMIRPILGAAADSVPGVTVAGASEELALFVRARPGDAEAPVVIHAVDASAMTQPFELRLDPRRLFGERPIRIELLRPTPYDAAAHQRAEDTQQFGELVERTALATGLQHTVAIPAPAPWSLIVVSPEPATDEVWPPSIAAVPASRADAELRVELSAATPGADIRFTLDGSAPGTASTRYAEPLTLRDSTVVAAVAVRGDRQSAPAIAHFRRLAAPTVESSPDAVDGLRLWLRAGDLPVGAEVPRWPARVGPSPSLDGGALHDGRAPTPPSVAAEVIGGRPAVRFVRETDFLRLPGFANAHLTRGFTVLLVCRSGDAQFGVAGNSASGSGGVPRLYLTRDGLTLNATRAPLGTDDTTGALLSFRHDGRQTVDTRQDGRTVSRLGAPEFAAVAEYGGGGHLVMPFWSGNRPHAGDVAELVVYDRPLTDAELDAVAEHLLRHYRLPRRPLWD